MDLPHASSLLTLIVNTQCSAVESSRNQIKSLVAETGLKNNHISGHVLHSGHKMPCS